MRKITILALLVISVGCASNKPDKPDPSSKYILVRKAFNPDGFPFVVVESLEEWDEVSIYRIDEEKEEELLTVKPFRKPRQLGLLDKLRAARRYQEPVYPSSQPSN